MRFPAASRVIELCCRRKNRPVAINNTVVLFYTRTCRRGHLLQSTSGSWVLGLLLKVKFVGTFKCVMRIYITCTYME
ncbi:hypothetical protein SISSUDRAFT_454219 [Sistotremastrum suecicum HHB10207 ss-3]|uniref:Uncharacterized protein n=1 Tax=Sistotremastrum suecicum HHB10207 ss-3 TaxID=1314776 RepID=A0A165Y912_9AGAM|nr:hypothetical protein SISSUDRAFT_453454 [Sistotremastrum suecicum HHB10207 ss-3]KZT33004.1 hypothetical protein SISSUDRAFT_454219 [Sistotremastrum suecicum HHB10207 ss-3]